MRSMQTAAATVAQCQLQTEDGTVFNVTAAPGPDEVPVQLYLAVRLSI